MNDHFLAGALLALTVFAANLSSAKAQGEAAKSKKAIPAQAAAVPARQPSVGVVAVLVDADLKARKREATVQAKAVGIHIVDPALVRDQPKAGQGHFHFRVDDGPVIATTASKLSFHDLKPGVHTFTVQLAGNDHSVIATAAELMVTVP